MLEGAAEISNWRGIHDGIASGSPYENGKKPAPTKWTLTCVKHKYFKVNIRVMIDSEFPKNALN